MARATVMILGLSLVGLMGCQMEPTVRVPHGQVPTARETIPDEQGYKMFRAEQGVHGYSSPGRPATVLG